MLRRTNIKRLFSQREENGVHDFVSFDLHGIIAPANFIPAEQVKPPSASSTY